VQHLLFAGDAPKNHDIHPSRAQGTSSTHIGASDSGRRAGSADITQAGRPHSASLDAGRDVEVGREVVAAARKNREIRWCSGDLLVMTQTRASAYIKPANQTPSKSPPLLESC
jgi:transposase InsO family protein